MKLELCVGTRPTRGYLHHDRVPLPEVDVLHDLNELPWPFEDGQFEEIRAIDCMEHLRLDVHQWLGECWRILEPNGLLEMRVPRWGTEIAYANPTHRRAFVHTSFDFWDPEHPWHELYGQYDPELAADGRLWRVEEARRSGDNLVFKLRKRALASENDA